MLGFVAWGRKAWEGRRGWKRKGEETHEAGKREFAQQKVGGALVAPDFLQRERAGPVAVLLPGAGKWIASCECWVSDWVNTHATQSVLAGFR